MAKRGRSTARKSKWPSLGLYVVPRNLRTDGPHAGTWRILFEVPARLRPSGWSPTIALPRAEPYCRGPHDMAAILRIRTDASALYEEMTAARSPPEPLIILSRKGSIPWLIEQWGGRRLLLAVLGDVSSIDVAMSPGDEGMDTWRDLEPRTRKFYVTSLRPIFAWSMSNNHPHVREMAPRKIREFLELWRDKPGQRKNVRGALAQLITVALEEGEITVNPLEAVKARRRKPQKGGRRAAVDIWEREDVDLHAHVARTVAAWRSSRGARVHAAWPGGARLLRLMYETGADSTDVITWKRGEGGHFVDDTNMPGIDFDRGKTGVAAFVPISRSLADEIRASGSIYLVTDPFGAPYRPVTDDARLRGHLGTLRTQVIAAGGRRRKWDHLRHTAATEADRAGIDLEDIRHLTAHKDSGMNRSVYVQRSRVKTIEIQRARGLIE